MVVECLGFRVPPAPAVAVGRAVAGAPSSRTEQGTDVFRVPRAPCTRGCGG